MKTKLSRIFSATLAVCMLLTLVPFNATEPFEDSGTISSEEMEENSDIAISENSIRNNEEMLDENSELDLEDENLEETDLSSEEEIAMEDYENEINNEEEIPNKYEIETYTSQNINTERIYDNYYEEKVAYSESSFTINGLNHYGIGPVLYHGDGIKTVKQIGAESASQIVNDGRESESDIKQDSNGNYLIWTYHSTKSDDCYIIEKIDGKYIITGRFLGGDAATENIVFQNWIPPKDGFILFSDCSRTYDYVEPMRNSFTVGKEVKIDDIFKSMKYYIGNTGISVSILDEPIPKEKAQRNNNLQTIDYASTLNKVDIKLFDYDDTINDKWLNNNKYPGFQNPGKSSNTPDRNVKPRNSIWTMFGDLITTDIEGAKNVANQGGDINKTSGNQPFITKYDSIISNQITDDGFPQLKDGTSLSYLFTNGDSVHEETRPGTNGLFQYDPETYTYYFNSRENIAIYNKEKNMFELYDGMITPNYTTYVFGNFMPFQDVQSTKKVSEANRDYFIEMLESCDYKAIHETNETKRIQYKKLSVFLERYITCMDEQFGENWAYLDSINEEFKSLGFHKDENGNFVPITDNDLDFSKLYNVDFDDEMNFWFGMTQEVNFYQPKDGMVGRNDCYEMTYKFTGDDDFLLYIDGDLFIDLTGLHRHHGAEINFAKGTVSYYSTDVNNDGDLIDEPILVKKFSELVSDKSKLNDNGTFKDITEYMNSNQTSYLDGWNEEKAMVACSHNLKLFYMERGSGSGVCRMNFNFPIIETKFNPFDINLEISKEIDTTKDSFDELGLDKNDTYAFPIVLREIKNIGDSEVVSNTVINTVINNKNSVRIEKLSYGKYFLEEIRDDTFKLVDMNIKSAPYVSLYYDDTLKGYIIEISDNAEIGSTIYLNIKNTIDGHNNNKHNIKNLFNIT